MDRVLFKSTFHLIKFEFRQITRIFPNMFFSAFFPLLLLLVFGSLYGNEPSPAFYGFGTIDILTPSYVGMIIAVNSLVHLPLSIAFYREVKVLKRFMATPINPIQVLISQYVVYFIISILSSIILIFMSFMVFDLEFHGKIAYFIFYFIVSSLSMSSIGFFITSLTSKTKTCGALSNFIYFPMIFLSGASFATELMPPNMEQISKFIPLTYSVNLLKEAWIGNITRAHGTNIMLLLGIFIVFLAASTITFRWE
jgi:ABC-2 type transport system permease protein